MSDTVYATVAGFIQFDPREKDFNNQKLREVIVQAAGSQKQVRVTVWPDFADVPLEKGDFIVAQGKAETRQHQGDDGITKVYNNLSASQLLRLPAAERKDTGRSSEPSSAARPIFALRYRHAATRNAPLPIAGSRSRSWRMSCGDLPSTSGCNARRTRKSVIARGV